MTDVDWIRIEGMISKAVEGAVKSTVNGKIDKLNNKLDPEHETYILKDVQPIIQGLNGAKIIGELFKWLAGIAAAYLLLKGIFIK